MRLAVYRAATTLGSPLIRLYLSYRKARGKEDKARFSERLGCPGRERPHGRLVWVHAASIGESLSLLPLIVRLREDRPDFQILVTTGTVTSARLMVDRLPEGAFHQYIPVDILGYVRKFLDHWRPDLVLWAESEFWPNLVSESAARGAPMILINGRISSRSFAGWKRHRRLIAKLLSGFALCLGQTEADSDRLRELGAPRAKCVGNLKFAAPALPVETEDLMRLEQIIGARPRWIAASTHAGEEDIAGNVHRSLKKNHEGLLTMIVPRQPGRGADIAETLRQSGLRVALRSMGEPIMPSTDIYIADTLGELGLFYRLVDVVFVGKSLVPLGGQNPLEPARLDCALIHGSSMANFQEIVDRLAAAGAALEVADEDALAAAVDRLLGSEPERRRLAAAAKAFTDAEASVLDAVVEELAPYLQAPLDDGTDNARA